MDSSSPSIIITTHHRRQLGETFGHVVPGSFYIMVSITLFLWMWKMWRNNNSTTETDEILYATNGGSQFLRYVGSSIFVVATTGFCIEGVGGVLRFGDFLFQTAHETMYFAFMMAGIVAILESKKRIAFDSWRLAMAMAFIVEGMVFYGHQLEQTMTEQALHYVMVQLSFFTAICFFWGTREPRSLLPHGLALVGMAVKGIWFFVIADVLYSGKYGHEGMNFMTGSVYMSAGLLLILVSAFYGCFFITRKSQGNNNDCCQHDDGTSSEFHGYAPAVSCNNNTTTSGSGITHPGGNGGKYRVVPQTGNHSTSHNNNNGDV
jgi:hypothetical protein